ncbi:DUF2207 domain-containing protein [Desulfovibrio litoralis]|uniref:Predicted membrane protein n=1 Tax=Desulfovibrio litoralis DSM 11393 TaxID=1121455 RepID=A0A1M7TLG7_9BACT|nr:DUF2207 domain-containing protein [Desulfovibrio litoralis]SHN71536.1 Predicted membrane protein [Desulfovibrio litoralis DSM 11393]
MKKIITFYFIFLTCLFVTLPAFATERITNYSSEIYVNTNGSIDVTENITFTVEGNRIRLGIFRDLPRSYKMYGRKVDTPVIVQSVMRNGVSENFWVEQSENNLRILTGAEQDRPENRLQHGEHTYTIKWSSQGHIRSFTDYDELYFNVTGNNWDFLIENATATIILPKNLKVKQDAAYIGYTGSTEKFSGVIAPDNTITFTSPRLLHPTEGLTVAVGFESGIIQGTIKESAYLSFVNKILEPFYPYLTLNSFNLLVSGLISLIFYLIVWIKYGKDESLGAIMPEFTPPKGVSPAVAAVIWEGRSYDITTVLAASMVNLASKGFITISDRTLIRDKNKNIDTLPPEEKTFITTAFKYTEAIETKTYYEPFNAAVNNYNKALKSIFTQYFIQNKKIVAFAMLIQAVIFIALSVILSSMSAYLLFGIFYMPFFLAIWNIIKRVSWESRIKIMIIMYFLIQFFALVVKYENMFNVANIVFFAILTSIMFINFIFYYLLDKPTLEATRILQHLSGLKMFMEVTDKDKYKLIDVSVFETNLPYAIIFGLETTWLSIFLGINPEYNPNWENSSHSFIKTGNFDNLHYGIDTARTEPTSYSYEYSGNSTGGGSSGSGFSSSGSSGGGFSGGGSGGGGGGGGGR